MRNNLLLLLFVWFSATAYTHAQHTNRLRLGLNYSWHNQTKADHTYSPAIGYGLGYHWNWTLKQKWRLDFGLALDWHNVMAEYHVYGNPIDKEPAIFACLPITGGYKIQKNTQIHLGYQFGYLINDPEITNANTRDHAGLAGVSYDLCFLRTQLSFQHSFNTVKEVYYAGLVGDLDRFTKHRSKTMAFKLSVFVPLNKRK